MIFGTHLALDYSDHVLDGGPNPPTEGELAPVKVVGGRENDAVCSRTVGHLSTSWVLVIFIYKNYTLLWLQYW